MKEVVPGARITTTKYFAVEQKKEHLPVCDVESAVFMVGGRSAPAVTQGRALVGRNSSKLRYTHLLVPLLPTVLQRLGKKKKKRQLGPVSEVICSNLSSL